MPMSVNGTKGPVLSGRWSEFRMKRITKTALSREGYLDDMLEDFDARSDPGANLRKWKSSARTLTQKGGS